MPNTNDIFGKDYGIYLEHLGGVLTSDEIKKVTDELVLYEINFIERDKSGVITNSIEEISNQVFVAITSPLILGIINGLLPNAAWDLIKSIALRVFKSISGKRYTKLTQTGAEDKLISFGIDIRLNNKERYIYKFDSVASDDTVLAALDKILDFTREQSRQSDLENYIEYLVQFDEKKMKWDKTNVLDYIRYRINKK